MKKGDKKAQQKEENFFQLTFLNRKGQMKISFGMIFSLILIIVIVAFAFFGIKKFLGVQKAATVGQFKNNLQDDVDALYLGPQGNPTIKYILPNDVEGVCFEENAPDSVYFLPRDSGYRGFDLNHVNWEKTVESNSKNTKLCIENIEGTVTIKLEKNFGDNLVTVLR